MDLGASGAHYTLDSISASVSLSPKLDHLRSMWTFILYLCFILLGKPNIYVVYKPVVDTKNNRLRLDPNYHLRSSNRLTNHLTFVVTKVTYRVRFGFDWVRILGLI